MLIILLCITNFLVHIANGYGSYMGSETSLRQSISDLLEGKLNFTEQNLPFEHDELSDSTPKNQSEYDFIVIGAGSAGATIASRLSEIENVTVLLIEAGGKEYSIIDIPLLAGAYESDKEVSWNYETEYSDEYCLQFSNRTCKWPAGKVMGGGSTINRMIAIRGNRRDYDEWAAEVGDESWSYENMLKYFKKLENFNSNDVRFNEQYHNQGGPVHISLADDHPTFTKSFIEAGKEIGYQEVDYNGPEQIGFAHMQTTIFEGERWSANRAYLRPAKSRKNLVVTQYSHVHKILIDRSTKIAYGVRFSKNSNIYDVKARKEIILSAGAINSPQILMLSGIGPEKHLQALNIEVIKDAPIGENLADHLMYTQLSFGVNDSSTLELPNILDPADASIKYYIDSRKGPLTYGSSMNALAFVNIDNFTDLHPNIRLSIFSGEVLTSLGKKPSKAYKIVPMILRPHSRGKILLRSNDPYEKPKLYPNYLEAPEDIRVLVKGIKFALKIAETNAMKKHGSVYQRGSSPCDIHVRGSDKFWECELRTYATTVQHRVGTCKMGRLDSNSTVVDSKLKVIGIHRLRVADASIIPNLVCAHTNIPVIAIGEKAADSIKMDHGYS